MNSWIDAATTHFEEHLICCSTVGSKRHQRVLSTHLLPADEFAKAKHKTHCHSTTQREGGRGGGMIDDAERAIAPIY